MFDKGKFTYKTDLQLGERYRDQTTGLEGRGEVDASDRRMVCAYCNVKRRGIDFPNITFAKCWTCHLRDNPETVQGVRDALVEIEGSGASMSVEAVTMYVAKCQCGWRQLHETQDNASRDGNRHVQDWHGSEPAR